LERQEHDKDPLYARISFLLKPLTRLLLNQSVKDLADRFSVAVGTISPYSTFDVAFYG